MKKNPKVALVAGAWLSPFLLPALLAGLLQGCNVNRSLMVGPAEAVPMENAFASIKARNTQSLIEREGNFKVEVHFGPGEDGHAEEALSLLRGSVSFLAKTTGLQAKGRVEAHLYPLEHGELPPHVEARGRADFTFVFFVSDGEPLLVNPYNRQWYDTLTHELVHTFFESLPISDRWLEDGLAEYLKAEYARTYRTEFPTSKARFPTTAEWLPPLEALRRVTWDRWRHQSTDRIVRLQRRDPALAAHLLNQEVWKYSAAGELLNRWLESVAEAGVNEPVIELIERIREQDSPIKWKDTRQLIFEWTGQTLQQIVEVSQEEMEAARQWAWEQRLAPEYPERVYALRLLTFLGLPANKEGGDLLDSLDLPELTPEGPYVDQTLALAATGALASSGDASAAASALNLLRQRHGKDLPLYLTPELLGLVAQVNDRLALVTLVEILNSPRVGLGLRDRANELLEDLTNESTGWALTLSPEERKSAANEWAHLLSATGNASANTGS